MIRRARGPARWTLVLLALVAGVAPTGPLAWAQEDVTSALIAAHAAGDYGRFSEILRTHQPNPWVVTDDLLARGRADVARACVESIEFPGHDALVHYLDKHQEVRDEGARAHLRRAYERTQRRDYDGVVAALEDVVVPEGSILEARIEILRSSALSRVDRPRDALGAFWRLADQAAALGWIGLERAALRNVNRLATAARQHGAASRALRRLADVYEGLGEPLRAARALADAAGLYAKAGDLRRSVDLLTTAYAALSEVGAEGDAAQTAVNASLLLARRGELGVAREWLDRAEVHLQEVDDPTERSRFIAVRAAIRTETGEYAAGRQDLVRVLETIPRSQTAVRRSILAQLGRVQHLDGDDEAAIATLEEVLALSRAAKDELGEGRVLSSLGIVLRSAGHPEKASAAFHGSLEKAGDDALNAGQVWLEVGRLRADAGEGPGALEAFQRAQSFLEQASAWDDLARVEHLRALTLLSLERTSEAYGHALRSIELLDHVVVGLSDEPMARTRQRRALFFDVGLRAAVAGGRAADAVTLLERWRARALLDAMGGRTRLRGTGLPEALAAEELEATEAVTLAHKRYREVRRTGLRRESVAAGEEIREAEARLREVGAQVQRTVKRVAALKYPQPLESDGVRAALRANEALAYYAADGDRLRAVVVRPDGERFVDLGEATSVSADLAPIEGKAVAAEDAQAALDRLQERLVGALELPEGVTTLYVCPQGDLCHVPWPALTGARDSACIPSGTVLAALRDGRRASGTKVLALGDPDYGRRGAGGIRMYFRGRSLGPLGETALEVKAITGSEDVTRTGAGATETAFKALVAQEAAWRSVHLACHGLIHPDSPMLSALALSSTEEDDGFLTVLDLLGMAIPTQLLVASACDSGRGDIVSGEGVIGLTRAFLIAGAERAIVSLWKVDDEATRTLMTKFYERWRDGEPPTEALRRAQAHVRDLDGGKWRHPRYWAAWVLWGRAD